MMITAITGGSVMGRPFDPIYSVQHSRINILTGADFKQPRKKSWLQQLFDLLAQEGRP